MKIATLAGGAAEIESTELEQLAAGLRGSLLAAGDPGYDAARVVFNGMFDRRPALIVRCGGTADVLAAVELAARHRLLVAVRGGGHSVAGTSMCDGGVVVDLSPMKGVQVDREQGVVKVEAGATWSDVDRETQLFGLATPGGVVSHTGVAGLTLGGGMGWLKRKYGLSCDNLLSAQVVTAGGEVLSASREQNRDLFWALRGGGGNFGVVTWFELKLHPVGPLVAAVFSMYPLAQARGVLERWRDWVSTAPEEVSAEAVLWTTPEAPGLPPAVHGREVIIAAGVFAGDAETGMEVLQPLRQLGEPLGEIVGPLPYLAVQSAFDPHFPNDGTLLSHWKSLYLEELGNAAIDIIVERTENRSSSRTMLWIEHLGGAIRRVGAGESAFSPRQPEFVMNFGGSWTAPRDTERHTAWVREAWDRLAPHGCGAVYLNFLGHEAGRASALVESAYGANYRRLAEIKARYDPENLFRLNQNIRPQVAAAG